MCVFLTPSKAHLSHYNRSSNNNNNKNARAKRRKQDNSKRSNIPYGPSQMTTNAIFKMVILHHHNGN